MGRCGDRLLGLQDGAPELRRRERSQVVIRLAAPALRCELELDGPEASGAIEQVSRPEDAPVDLDALHPDTRDSRRSSPRRPPPRGAPMARRPGDSWTVIPPAHATRDPCNVVACAARCRQHVGLQGGVVARDRKSASRVAGGAGGPSRPARRPGESGTRGCTRALNSREDIGRECSETSRRRTEDPPSSCQHPGGALITAGRERPMSPRRATPGPPWRSLPGVGPCSWTNAGRSPPYLGQRSGRVSVPCPGASPPACRDRRPEPLARPTAAGRGVEVTRACEDSTILGEGAHPSSVDFPAFATFRRLLGRFPASDGCYPLGA